MLRTVNFSDIQKSPRIFVDGRYRYVSMKYIPLKNYSNITELHKLRDYHLSRANIYNVLLCWNGMVSLLDLWAPGEPSYFPIMFMCCSGIMMLFHDSKEQKITNNLTKMDQKL